VMKPKVSTKGLKGHTRVYAPEGSEFDMLVTELKSGEEEHITGLQGPGIVVVTKGEGKLHAKDVDLELKEGYAFFVGYDTDLKLVANGGEGLDIHMSFCEA
jgi:mannose-6-phosphate isomerase